MKYAILAVLCLATSVFAAVSYDAPTKTLTYGAASDLSAAVDPEGGQDLTDPAAMTGNLTKDGFNALSGLQVIDFNAELGTFNATTSIKATYDATHVLTFTDFGNPAGYNMGGGTSQGRVQHSGANAYNQFGTIEGAVGAPGTYHLDPEGGVMGHNWFAASLSVNEANAGVGAIGFVVDGRDTSGNYTDVSKIWITLSDATEVSYDTVQFGGGIVDVPAGIGFFYEAPAGLFITRIEATRNNAAGSSYVALDDLGFVIRSNGAPLYIHAHDGDTNNDGACNVVDLGVLAKYYDSTGLPTSAVDPFGAGSWQKADFNNDGNVNVVDLGVLAKNYDWVGDPAVPTPEPMTLSLLAAGALALIRRRK